MSRIPSLFVLSLFVLGFGCQQESEIGNISGFKMPEPVVLSECEGPGFRYGIPPGWVSSNVGTTAVAKPASSAGKVTVTMQLTAYAAGETPESVIEVGLGISNKKKMGYEHLKVMTAGFPTVRQLYRNDGKKDVIPDRVTHLIATPIGKITIMTEIANQKDLVPFRVDVERIADSIKF